MAVEKFKKLWLQHYTLLIVYPFTLWCAIGNSQIRTSTIVADGPYCRGPWNIDYLISWWQRMSGSLLLILDIYIYIYIYFFFQIIYYKFNRTYNPYSQNKILVKFTPFISLVLRECSLVD